jgi:hypothetical protein
MATGYDGFYRTYCIAYAFVRSGGHIEWSLVNKEATEPSAAAALGSYDASVGDVKPPKTMKEFNNAMAELMARQ